MNLYQHAINQTISLFCYTDIFDLKILQPDWPRAFWPTSQEPDFSQITHLCGNIANDINFHYRPNSGRIKDQSFQ